MGFRDSLKKAISSIGKEAKEKLPYVVSDISQQTLEAAPMWDQGWANQAQGNRQAREIHKALNEPETTVESKAEQKLESIDMHLAALTKLTAERLERQKEKERKRAQEQPKHRRGPRR